MVVIISWLRMGVPAFSRTAAAASRALTRLGFASATGLPPRLPLGAASATVASALRPARLPPLLPLFLVLDMFDLLAPSAPCGPGAGVGLCRPSRSGRDH